MNAIETLSSATQDQLWDNVAGSAVENAVHSRQWRLRTYARRMLVISALILLALWGRTWIASIEEDHLVGAAPFFPRFEHLGYDFYRTYHANQDAVNDRDPYQDLNDEARVERYNHPPVVRWLFFWSIFFTFRVANVIWTTALAAMAAFCVWRCWLARAQLGLPQPPFVVMLAMFLWSTPVLFSLERGNWDLLAASLVLFALPLAGRVTLVGDVVAGVCLALCGWIKVYPYVLLVGLAALRRWRLVGCTLAVGALMGLADLEGIRSFARNMQESIVLHSPALESLAYEHSLGSSWGVFWSSTVLAALTKIPGHVAASVLLAPGIAWVSYRAHDCADWRSIACPYFLWLMAAACFLLPIAYDYKLIFLLLTLLTTWDRRDPMIAHIMVGLLLVPIQPFNVALSPRLLFLFKAGGFVGVTICLRRRINERAIQVVPLRANAARSPLEFEHVHVFENTSGRLARISAPRAIAAGPSPSGGQNGLP